jgi:hypothetical protein
MQIRKLSALVAAALLGKARPAQTTTANLSGIARHAAGAVVPGTHTDSGQRLRLHSVERLGGVSC